MLTTGKDHTNAPLQYLRLNFAEFQFFTSSKCDYIAKYR
jgi:hypothetical protein